MRDNSSYFSYISLLTYARFTVHIISKFRPPILNIYTWCVTTRPLGRGSQRATVFCWHGLLDGEGAACVCSLLLRAEEASQACRSGRIVKRGPRCRPCHPLWSGLIPALHLLSSQTILQTEWAFLRIANNPCLPKRLPGFGSSSDVLSGSKSVQYHHRVKFLVCLRAT
jgi:hypothetical protein